MRIYQGSILDVEADTIVNPANSHLRHGGGLAAIIAKAAAPLAHFKSMDEVYYFGGPDTDPADWQGDQDWTNEQINHPLIATGNAGWTSAGRLPYKGIVHAVGPIWNGGNFCEAALLRSAHQHAFAQAILSGCQSIAVPAISCGIFGYPVHLAAPIAVDAAVGAERIGLDVTFALFEDEHVAQFSKWVPA